MDPQASQTKILQSIPHDLGLFLLEMKKLGKERNIPNISWNTAFFLIEKLRDRKITNILEIGPANGFSTMMLALACSEANITSIECSRHAFEELRHNLAIFDSLQKQRATLPAGRQESKEQRWGISFKPANFPPKVTSEISQENIGQFSLYYGDAREILPAFEQGVSELICKHPKNIIRDIPAKKFDCIFIDGAFRMTREFFDLSRPLLHSDGIIILDDAIKYRWKMDGFHEYLEKEGIHYSLIQTDEDDGVMVIQL